MINFTSCSSFNPDLYIASRPPVKIHITENGCKANLTIIRQVELAHRLYQSSATYEMDLIDSFCNYSCFISFDGGFEGGFGECESYFDERLIIDCSCALVTPAAISFIVLFSICFVCTTLLWIFKLRRERKSLLEAYNTQNKALPFPQYLKPEVWEQLGDNYDLIEEETINYLWERVTLWRVPLANSIWVIEREQVVHPIKKFEDCHLIKADSEILKETTFVSHKWYGNEPDDPLGLLVVDIKRQIATKYVWIDYCCTPQETVDIKLILTAILKIPKMNFFMHQKCLTLYQESLWCQLERIVQDVEKNASFRELLSSALKSGEDEPREKPMSKMDFSKNLRNLRLSNQGDRLLILYLFTVLYLETATLEYLQCVESWMEIHKLEYIAEKHQFRDGDTLFSIETDPEKSNAVIEALQKFNHFENMKQRRKCQTIVIRACCSITIVFGFVALFLSMYSCLTYQLPTIKYSSPNNLNDQAVNDTQLLAVCKN